MQHLFCCAVLSLFLAASSLSASTLYASDYAGAAQLFSVDQTTAALTAVGSPGATDIGDMTSDLTKLIAIRIPINQLYTIDPATGMQTPGVTITGSRTSIVSLAYDVVTNTLYGNTSVGFGAANDGLYSIDMNTGAATYVGDIGFNQVYALAFNNSGMLYGVDGGGNLITIDKTTGAGTQVGSTGQIFVFDIAFRPEDNVLFAVETGTSSLFTINPATGVASLVGSYGSTTNLVGLGFTAVPEPGTLALMASSGLALIFASRRTRRHA